MTTTVADLQLWLLEAMLLASASDEIEAQQLLRLPESFPFTFTVGVGDLRKHEGFDIHRQGLDTDMVALRQIKPAPQPKPTQKKKQPASALTAQVQPTFFDEQKPVVEKIAAAPSSGTGSTTVRRLDEHRFDPGLPKVAAAGSDPGAGVLSEQETERHFQRQEMLLEFSRLFDYKEASDRAIAIVGPAFLDTLLNDILTEFLVEDEKEVYKLLQPEGPLGTYGSRVTACYCLGLIGEIVTADLRLVGKIRNQFAHNIRAHFSDQKISQWCRGLRWHKELLFADPPADATDRDLFQVGVNALVMHLNGVPSIARSRKRLKVKGT
jgi:DNA-binding MltR family transcriptional regulator